MLVLTRLIGESIVVETPSGEKLTITIIDVVSRNKVRIGFDGAKNIFSIFRSELLTKEKGENQDA